MLQNHENNNDYECVILVLRMFYVFLLHGGVMDRSAPHAQLVAAVHGQQIRARSSNLHHSILSPQSRGCNWALSPSNFFVRLVI